MPLGRAPKRMVGSGLRSDRDCGHSPGFSFGAAAWAWEWLACGSLGRPSAAADAVTATIASAVRPARQVLFIQPLKARPARWRRNMHGRGARFKARLRRAGARLIVAIDEGEGVGRTLAHPGGLGGCSGSGISVRRPADADLLAGACGLETTRLGRFGAAHLCSASDRRGQIVTAAQTHACSCVRVGRNMSATWAWRPLEFAGRWGEGKARARPRGGGKPPSRLA